MPDGLDPGLAIAAYRKFIAKRLTASPA